MPPRVAAEFGVHTAVNYVQVLPLITMRLSSSTKLSGNEKIRMDQKNRDYRPKKALQLRIKTDMKPIHHAGSDVNNISITIASLLPAC